MILKKYRFLILFLSVSIFSMAQNVKEKSSFYHYSGRVELQDNNKVILISAASSVSFDFIGKTCKIFLQNVTDQHSFIALELDGNYIGRIRIEKGIAQTFPVKVTTNKKTHHLAIYKATEASTGGVMFIGTTAKLIKSTTPNRNKIEYIGDSITSGFGNDTAEIPCGTGGWFDQHNGYWAYGAIVARSLNLDYVLSSVSGFGMYRNWNDDHKEEPNIPDVYENLNLDTNTSKPYDFAFQPDLVSICLGTNDLSDGDGKKERLPFSEDKYVSNYIAFIKTVYQHTPNTRIVLLNSPMVSGDRNVVLVRCLKKVIQAFENDAEHKTIALFEFQSMQPNGCGSHPDIADDKIMASQLTPFLKKILDEK
ncbi:GDSL-type esterase/lipase family protein [Flavobacterium sp. WC2409]|uniref:GDSL-type esterase/lipase family protein n=1 Tax=Flavobacterium sp. WC2409 TaxID=3234139 RepID=A0AB39W607_9FLAO